MFPLLFSMSFRRSDDAPFADKKRHWIAALPNADFAALSVAESRSSCYDIYRCQTPRSNHPPQRRILEPRARKTPYV